jgi:putative transposase
MVTGANTPDKTVAVETVEGIGVPRPERVVSRLPQLWLDKGYD